MRRSWIIALALFATTLALYTPVCRFDLVYFDDPLLLTEPPQVQAGITWASLKWAFTSVVIANWQPMTNLSFLLVSQFFGTAPGAHHFANAILHALNAGLLFLLLERLTKRIWPCAISAAIFAWHPLRVESVAWIAERKDVLCAFFFLLALYLYTRFAQASNAGRGLQPASMPLCKATLKRSEYRVPETEIQDTRLHSSEMTSITRKSKLFYAASLLAFALALLSKPMAVTLPCVLLLLDVWPLGRTGRARSDESSRTPLVVPYKLLAEKIPFFVLTILFCLATYRIQRDYAAMAPWEKLGLSPRVANAISGYLAYPAKLLWPTKLAVLYPYPKDFDVLQTVLKAAFLVAISFGCLVQLGRRPWLAVGWFWYLGTALPIIGLVQVGGQAMADRYTYLPLIGPVIALVWTVADLLKSRAGVSPAQRALQREQIASGAYPGGALNTTNIFSTVLAIGILAILVAVTERQLQFWRNSVALFGHTVDVSPNNASAESSLGISFEHAGDTNRAIVCFRAAEIMAPGDFENRRSLAGLLGKQGHLAAAEQEYRQLLADDPADARNHLGLANTLAGEGLEAESVAQLDETLRLDPDCVDALNNLAWILATSPHTDVRDGNRAMTLAEHACELTHFGQTIYIGTLAAACAEAGKFDDAIATAQRACASAEKKGETTLLQRNRQLLQLYQDHKTARE